MSSSAAKPPHRRGRHAPLFVTAVYAAVGASWILFTDRLVSVWVDDPGTLTQIQTFKGWLYVLVTAVLLYWLIRRPFTALQESEQQIRRANRALHTVGACSEAVIRAADESQLLQEVCRIVVEVGGYHQAQVCFLEAGEGSTVRRVAQAGCPDAGPETLSVAGAGAEFAGSPLEEAVRTSRPAVRRDVPAVPQPEPRRADAASPRDGSLVVLPLLVDRRARGALSICSTGPAAFDSEEVSVLERLAGDVGHAVATLRARAKHARAEQELSESQRALATLMSNLPGMAYRCRNDRDWTMEFVSRGCSELTGYQPADLVNNSRIAYAELIHPDDQEPVWNDVQAAVAQKEPFRLVYRIVTATGGQKWVWEQGRGVFADDGGLLALEGFITDITERKRLEEQLRHAQKMEAVGQLAGGVAHDFNNVLTAILGHVDLMKNRPDSPERVAAGLENIDQATQRAAALTRQLLAVSRRQVAKPEVLDLNEVLTDIEPMLRRLIDESITLQTVPAPDLSHVRADSGQMEQVAMNLVVNARDAMPEGGILTIETANVDLDEGFVAAHAGAQPGPHVMLAVGDTGCGMSADVVERIFEPFFTTKAPGKGTGLGLWSVFGIVEKSGGNIWVSSEPGQGTTFRIYLPVVEDAVPERPPAAASLAGGGDETVLVVEDENMVRQLTRRILDEGGYRVLDAPSGGAALQIAAEHAGRIDLLVTDVVMPDMDGLTLVATLRQARPETRVLYVSGHASSVIADHGVLADGVELLEKPFGAEGLLSCVRRILDGDGPPSSGPATS